MKRNLFSPEHEDFRDTVAAFVASELVPYHADGRSSGVFRVKSGGRPGVRACFAPTCPRSVAATEPTGFTTSLCCAT